VRIAVDTPVDTVALAFKDTVVGKIVTMVVGEVEAAMGAVIGAVMGADCGDAPVKGADITDTL
jgi:hypothetical protein